MTIYDIIRQTVGKRAPSVTAPSDHTNKFIHLLNIFHAKHYKPEHYNTRLPPARYNGAPIKAELSPVTDFREACCRQYEMGECTRAGNFISCYFFLKILHGSLIFIVD